MPPTTRCPHCFTDIASRPQTAYVCQGACGTVRKEGYDTAEVRRITWVTAESLQAARPASVHCSVCAVETSVQACPECWFVLPPGWRSSYVTCVAMAGARASGKSFYIAVMKRSLDQIFEQSGRPFDFADQASADLFSARYEEPVFVQRNLLEATRPFRETSHEQAALIFKAGAINGYQHHLVIRDVAGEDLESPGPLSSPRFDFFANADAIVFLVDPMRVDAIRAMLEGLVPQGGRIGGDPQQVLARVLTKIQDPSLTNGRPPRLCLVLSKFDVMQSLADIEGSEWAAIMGNAGAAFLRDPSLNSLAYDPADGQLLHEEVRSLLVRLGAGGMVNQAKGGGLSYRLFAVSALGQHSEGDKIHARGISPFRCADPLKWVLHEAGALPGAPAGPT